MIFYADDQHWPDVNSFVSKQGFILQHYVVQKLPTDRFGQVETTKILEHFVNSTWDNSSKRLSTIIVLYIPIKQATSLISTLHQNPLLDTGSSIGRRFIIPIPEVGNYNLQALTELAEQDDIIIVRQKFETSDQIN